MDLNPPRGEILLNLNQNFIIHSLSLDMIEILTKMAKDSISSIHPSLNYHYNILTLKAPIMTAADDIHKYFFIVFQRK